MSSVRLKGVFQIMHNGVVLPPVNSVVFNNEGWGWIVGFYRVFEVWEISPIRWRIESEEIIND